MAYHEKSDEALKLYYSMQEVSLKINETTSCIRVWGDIFGLDVLRGHGNERRYTAQNIADLLEIKSLLRDKGYTQEDARAIFKGNRKKARIEVPNSYRQSCSRTFEKGNTSDRILYVVQMALKLNGFNETTTRYRIIVEELTDKKSDARSVGCKRAWDERKKLNGKKNLPEA